MDEKYIEVLDENGQTVKAEVIFTFEDDNDKYVLFTLVDELEDVKDFDHEYEVLAYMYEEKEDGTIGNLIEIDDDDTKRWEIVSEVFATFEETEFKVVDEE